MSIIKDGRTQTAVEVMAPEALLSSVESMDAGLLFEGSACKF